MSKVNTKEKARFLYKGRLSPENNIKSYIKEESARTGEKSIEMVPPSRSISEPKGPKDEKNAKRTTNSAERPTSTSKCLLDTPEGPKDPVLDQKPPISSQKPQDESSTTESMSN